LAGQVYQELRARNSRLVLAESCTGGLVAALLTRIPGVSEFLCGSAVVYQIETKARWLRVSRRLLRERGAVSAEVASEMATKALVATPHADISAAVTGHLGPGAPPGKDGLVFVAFGRRAQRGAAEIAIKKLELVHEAGDRIRQPQKKRLRRQRSAATHVLEWILVNLPKTNRK
jgi:nicotinamide-nucleotide amidase